MDACAVKSQMNTTLSYTPTVEELLPNYKVACQQPNCAAIFSNAGNYDMHLQKCHNITDTAKRSYQQFHCPHPGCIYNRKLQADAKFFKNMKYLRQHYRKVHGDKSHACSGCTKKFHTPGLLRWHLLNECGITFSCMDCSSQYDNLSALLIHAKRRGHTDPKEKYSNIKTKSARSQNQSIQTDDDVKPADLKAMPEFSCQTVMPPVNATNSVATATLPEDFDDFHIYLRNMETQTDMSLDLQNLSDWSYVNMADLMLTPQDNSTPNIKELNAYVNGEQQTDGYSYANLLCEASVQTESDVGRAVTTTPTHNVSTITIPEDFEEFNNFLRNMETQTETGYANPPKSIASTNTVATTTVPDFDDLQLLMRTTQHTQTEVSPNSGVFDQMFGGHSTQLAAQPTCGDEDFLSVLGLVDMHTQTNLSCAEWMPSTATKSTSCEHDLLLVSAETQTSFAQCMLDCRAANTNTADPYTTTQYTQTCDDLLESLFNDGDTDYMGGFQSSYTQT